MKDSLEEELCRLSRGRDSNLSNSFKEGRNSQKKGNISFESAEDTQGKGFMLKVNKELESIEGTSIQNLKEDIDFGFIQKKNLKDGNR